MMASKRGTSGGQNHLIDELKASIEAISDPEDKEIALAMAVLVSSLGVGADVDRLASSTGVPIRIVQAIADIPHPPH
jgi:hypothetical protein